MEVEFPIKQIVNGKGELVDPTYQGEITRKLAQFL